ncbi:MAG TPA: malonyl-[acyl-carrier protein] O-methyltransferase BioC [Paenibacillaceae bacterium]|nr:malonyl-[acyl-carrier protein] O-methyltransferase BioC [Paenibacillaceae bacterium]
MFTKPFFYHGQYAKVQKVMGDTLLTQMQEQKKTYHNILEIGCGTGYLTKKLREMFPEAKMTLVDIAPGMIDYVKSTLPPENMKFICGDMEELDVQDTYDLIISNATFQWFNQLENTIQKLVASLQSEGTLAFSTFGDDTFYELHEATNKAKIALNRNKQVQPGPSFYSLDQIEDMFIGLGLNHNQTSFSESYYKEHFNKCREFLHAVKKIGANNSLAGNHGMGVALMKKVMEIYDQDYEENNQVRATYHTMFVSYRR